MKKLIFLILILTIFGLIFGCDEPVCYDQICQETENNPSSQYYCPADCSISQPVCGNNICEKGEETTNGRFYCEKDCSLEIPSFCENSTYTIEFDNGTKIKETPILTIAMHENNETFVSIIRNSTNGEDIISNDPTIIAQDNNIGVKESKVFTFPEFNRITHSTVIVSGYDEECKKEISKEVYIPIGDVWDRNNISLIIPRELHPDYCCDLNGNWVTLEKNFGELNDEYNFADIFHIAYNYQKNATQTIPQGKEPLVFSFNYYMCGAAGYTDLGLGHGCIMQNDIQPHWSVFFHESGHELAGRGISDRWDNFMNSTELDFSYSEGFATILSAYSIRKILDNNHSNIPQISTSTLNQMYSNMENDFYLNNKSLEFYNSNGSFPDDINPDVIDGFMWTIIEDKSINEYGWEIIPRFFRVFGNNGIEADLILDKSDDLFVTALSAAAGNDLRPKFTSWKYTIDNNYYETTLPKVKSIIGNN